MYFQKSESFEFSRKAISRILSIAVVLVIILGIIVGVFYFLRSSNDVPKPTPTPTPSATTTETPSPSPSEWIPNGNIEENEYTHNALFADGSLEIYWKNDNEYFCMALKGQSKGWLAVGFEPSFRMKDADMIFGWVTEREVIVLDLYSTGPYGPHPPDTELDGSNDIFEYGGKEGETNTVIEFKRKLNTGDVYDEPLSQGQTITIIWAMATSDSLNTQHNIVRGTGQIILD
jgi:hypothetical protein